MIYGLSGAPVAAVLRYAAPINEAAEDVNFSPPLLYAIGYHETIHGEIIGLWPSAQTVVSGDGGHGIFQLTSSFPPNWYEAYCNAHWAITGPGLLGDCLEYWHELGFAGDQLVKLVAASFNEGLSAAEAAYKTGNVDAGTTDGYGEAVVLIYNSIISTGGPGNYV
jgi:hypothetical protein